MCLPGDCAFDMSEMLPARWTTSSLRSALSSSITTKTPRFSVSPPAHRTTLHSIRALPIVLSGTLFLDRVLVGHYYHAWSGLHLAFYRAYDAELGRWLSRDPLGEAGGFTLYDYALNSPIMLVDELGLKAGSMKCESRVSAGHPGQVDQEERAFWSNREHPKCGSKFYGISCGIRANGHYVWGSEKQREDAAAKPDVDENGNTNVKPSPGDPLLRDMLAEKLALAEKDAIAQCRKPDNCCQTILIKADCIPSPDDLPMKNARVYDRRLDELCRTKKTIDCRTIQ